MDDNALRIDSVGVAGREPSGLNRRLRAQVGWTPDLRLNAKYPVDTVGYRLTRAAAVDVSRIYLASAEQFGIRQADAYHDLLAGCTAKPAYSTISPRQIGCRALAERAQGDPEVVDFISLRHLAVGISHHASLQQHVCNDQQRPAQEAGFGGESSLRLAVHDAPSYPSALTITNYLLDRYSPSL